VSIAVVHTIPIMPTPSLIVRPAQPTDVGVVATLIEEIERHYGATVIQPLAERSAQVDAALFGDPPLAHALLALVDGLVAGIATYSFQWPAAGSTHSLFLKELYVRPDRRGLGIGTRLVDRVRAIAEARPGCSRVEWMADRDNEAARAFYRRLGVAEFTGKINYRVTIGTC
jgi:ribosomal protein S18 acetylase RimI-like enzyme